MSLEARRERAAVRILEDETLRGDLTDDAYAPLQAWALAWIDADPDRVDWIKAQLRRVSARPKSLARNLRRLPRPPAIETQPSA